MATRRVTVAAVGLWAVAIALTVNGAAQDRESRLTHDNPVFQTSDTCLACHNGMTTPTGEDVSIGLAWRASIMANSSRDPYWQASVRRETLDHPRRARAVEDMCANCHMPMSHAAAHANGQSAEVFNLLAPVRPATPAQRLAAGGVSCTLCHQITPDRLGTRESFVGGFVIAGGAPRMFWPFDVDRGRTTIMRSATGATPTAGEHVRQSELCATCHTLYTEAIGPTGEIIGTLPEQVPFLEWRHSSHREERSCQSCHMPTVESAPMTSVLGERRERLGRHTFLGGNFFMLRMLGRYRDELAVEALPQELDAAATATIRQLERETATVSIRSARVRDNTLDIDVVVRNMTGHKLPTGYPSRRAWLHVAVRDQEGRAIFESGGVTETGMIGGNDNDADGSRFEPHYASIQRPDQVQIYESILGGIDGGVTTGLLSATRFLKDNRLLPRGFEKVTASQDIAVIGDALADEDFTGDGDRIRYLIDISGVPLPLAIDVALRYQPIAFRWADNLRPYASAEPRRFVSYFDSMAAASSAVLAHTTTVVR
jgi:hypothetical protein